MKWTQLTRYQVAVFIMGICSLALVAAWISEYIFGLLPCSLCLYQRYLYLAAIVVLATHLFMLGGKHSNLSFILGSLILFTCASTAAYQVAVENHWVEVPQVCTSILAAQSPEDLKNLVYAQAPIACDEVQFSIFGLSMAFYNALLAFGLGFLCLIGVTLDDEKKKKFARR